ncbi:reverse transcriptase protein [Rutstroemia sp. NJR-2017a WRK4]|nr:reverse transcriptase protein [Rutstroemia sp. NJR-2017a WRK4]
MTQIKRIRYLIHPLVHFQYLESISSFKFPLWTTTPYSVEISKLSKELEAENHKNSAILLAPNQYSIYTDESSWNIGTSQLIYNSELAGIAEGIKLVSKIAQKGQEFTIFSDNQAALQRLKSLSDEPRQSQVVLAYEAS